MLLANESHRSPYNDIVYVKVGDDATTFGIHRGLLCRQSSYFKAALSGNLKEAKEGVVVLEGEDAGIFERFNLWLYTGRFLKEDETVKDVGWETSIQIYIFAETHGAHRLQNTTIDHMIRMNAVLKVLPGSPDIRRAWSGTSGASPIKRFLVDLYTRKADLPTIFGSGEKYKGFQMEFMVGIALAFHKMKRDRSMYELFEWLKERCRWHVHEVADPICV